jgi:phosphatidate phosphatase
VELFRNSQIRTKNLAAGRVTIPWLILDLYRVLGHFVQGALATVLITEVAKVSIGRLRPHFLYLCGPDKNKCKDFPDKFWGTNPVELREVCTNYANFGTALTFQNDTAGNPLYLTELEFDKKMREARLSFMSGHTSTSFYAALFLILYFQARLDRCLPEKGTKECIRTCLKAFRPLIQACLMGLALWISFSRVSDYFHHPLDVAVGAFVGILMAFVTLSFSRLSKEDHAFGRHYPEVQAGTVRNSPKSGTAGARHSLKPGEEGAPKTIDDFTRARVSHEV